MSKLHLDAITSVAHATIAGEQGADGAIRSLASLVVVATNEAGRVGLPPHSTQPAFEHLRAAINSAFDARASVIAAHEEFGRIAGKLGATPQAFGDLWPCPKFPSGAASAAAVILHPASQAA